ncbi:GntR family transcriptional regulator [Caulobacter radicis]|uniref:HTH gntR-type domain-containing protein n=1 Tax=Caulobacter radicis TaxID=2172650 RepID=A0A2T9JB18_9CAUL|nr:hypothetical protein DDF65_14980 [Caulobacter radicis]PVM83539.1 hypothetical protein DDF62_24860 [Caulobacter radicis]
MEGSLLESPAGSGWTQTIVRRAPDVGQLRVASLESASDFWALPSEPGPLYRQLYALIRYRLATGELRVGDRLPDERRLARLCGVSRLTVRSAFALLCADGCIQRRTRLGTIIRAVV